MIRTLVALAHNIGMRVIVEGVETPEQLEFVRALGANEVQGFIMGVQPPILECICFCPHPCKAPLWNPGGVLNLR